MAEPKAWEEFLTWAFSPSWSSIILALVVTFTLPALIHGYLYKKAVAKEVPSFLLAGPSAAGKTSLLTLFSTGSATPTYTSQSPSTALVTLPSKIRTSEDKYRSENDNAPRSQPTFQLIDTPGHGKLRHHALSTLTESTTLKGIIFVVDSAAASLTEAAEYLHDILLALQKRHTQNRTSKGPSSIPVLVAANKQDVFSATPVGLLKTKLEEEVGRIRQTKSRGVIGVGGGASEDDAAGEDEDNWLGEFGSKDFKFAQMEEHGVEVKLIGGNVKNDDKKGDVDGWWVWVGENL
ncbi:Putative signal recognition particle receptor, beta subunit [Septoria linicola]|uniref:Signal recognition particle receptor subunit beta n=1 Tax=Septoria linicola TaxID=215465 RepID=A0A9Q9AYX3_9PEZI|nr:Putative signal recognition particle receptor, beta subunit [Septoria linicola]